METAAHPEGTVGKALSVLDAVASHGRPVRFSDLLASSRYPKATLYRLLQTLTHQGMLSFDPETQTYAPGLRLVRMAHAAWRTASLAPIAQGFLDALSRDVGETVHLGQMDGGHVLYVDKRNARIPVEMFAQAGKTGPAYCTGVGKAMLAFYDAPTRDSLIAQQSLHGFTPNTLTSADALRRELDAIRARGHAFDDEEHEPGIICVALPILSRSGRPIGGLSVTSTTERHSLDSLAAFVPRIDEARRQIADAAVHWRFPETPSLPEKREPACQD